MNRLRARQLESFRGSGFFFQAWYTLLPDRFLLPFMVFFTAKRRESDGWHCAGQAQIEIKLRPTVSLGPVHADRGFQISLIKKVTMSLSVHRVLKTRRQSRWACFNESIWDLCGSYRLGIDEQQKAGLFTERSMQTLLDSILRFKFCRSFKKEGTASFGYDGLLIKQPNSFSGKSLSRFLLQHELDVNQFMPNPIVTFSTQHPCL